MPQIMPQKNGWDSSLLCSCLVAWIRKLLWPGRPRGTTDALVCSSLEECAYTSCGEHSSLSASSQACFYALSAPSGRHPAFGVESAFCNKYVNNIQALKTSRFLPLLHVFKSIVYWSVWLLEFVLSKNPAIPEICIEMCEHSCYLARSAHKLPDNPSSLLNSGKHII